MPCFVLANPGGKPKSMERLLPSHFNDSAHACMSMGRGHRILLGAMLAPKHAAIRHQFIVKHVLTDKQKTKEFSDLGIRAHNGKHLAARIYEHVARDGTLGVLHNPTPPALGSSVREQ